MSLYYGETKMSRIGDMYGTSVIYDDRKDRPTCKAETFVDSRLIMDQAYQVVLNGWKGMIIRSNAFSTNLVVVASPRELRPITG